MEVHQLRAKFRALRTGGAGKGAWEEFALEVFRFQAAQHPVYREFLQRLDVDPKRVQSAQAIPHVPVEAFVHRTMGIGETVFRSSGTLSTGRRAEHAVDDPAWYEEVAVAGFERLYGPLEGWVVGGLLPGYLGRGDASLVHMVRAFGLRSASGHAGLFDRADAAFESWMEAACTSGHKVLLLGVTHALLGWKPARPMAPEVPVVLMETGGMKGMGEELVREQVHATLRAATGLSAVHSEYGMTECLSQAYAGAGGRFCAPPWMLVHAVEVDDPGCRAEAGRHGRIAIADLANLHSVAFLATGDLGKMHEDGTFEVLGRHDRAEVRGCNLML